MTDFGVAAGDFPEFLFTTWPTSIEQVVEMLQAIDDALPDDDGLKWWNKLYLITTKLLHQQDRSLWEDYAWLSQLDINFAERYFDALRALFGGAEKATASWQALFNSRHRHGLDRIQFGLAGMNTHINFDLAQALAKTDAEMPTGFAGMNARYRDYKKVNKYFELLIPEALAYLHSGIWGSAANLTGWPGRMVALLNIQAMRGTAWDFSMDLSRLSPALAAQKLGKVDRRISYMNRLVLLPMDPTRSRGGMPRCAARLVFRLIDSKSDTLVKSYLSGLLR